MTTKKFIEKLKEDYIRNTWEAEWIDLSGGDSGHRHFMMDYINELLKRLGKSKMNLDIVFNKESYKRDLIDKNTGKIIGSR